MIFRFSIGLRQFGQLSGTGSQLQTAATAKGEILAVVVAFTREVVQG